MNPRARVCLIDDDVMVREAMTLGLRDAGFDVIAAPSAAAAIELTSHEHVHALVIDASLPGTTGAAHFIPQARSHWPTVPIIAISGAALIDGRDTAVVTRQLGADATLIKPFRAQRLAFQIERLLAQHEPDA